MKKIRLTSICSPKQWKTIPTKDLLDEGYPVYGANGVIGYCKEYNHTSDTIIIGCRGSCGNVNIARGKSYINGNAMCLDDLSSDVDILYLYYFLQNYDFRSVISGTTIPQVTKQGLEKIDVVVSSKENQREIVRQLQLLDSIIEERHKELRYFDALIKSRFIEMFGNMESNPKGWRQSTLGDECYYIKDGPHKSPKYLDSIDGIPFISTRNVVSGDGIDWSTAKYISEADYLDCIKKCHPEKGDILYSKGGTTGIAKLVDTDIRFANWVHVAVLKFGAQLDGRFLECMLNMNYCYAQSQALTKGIANKDFVLSAIAQVKIYVPPIELQRKYTEFVKRTDKSKFEIQQSLEKLEILKKSLMQQYFG